MKPPGTPSSKAWLIWPFTLVITVVFLALFVTGIRIAEKNAPLVDAAMEIKLELTAFHLMLMERIEGEDVPSERLWQHMENAEWYAAAMLHGGKNQEGTFAPVENPVLRNKLNIIIEEMRQLRELALVELESLSHGAKAGDGDPEFDKIFRAAVEDADNVETAIQRHIEKQLKKFRSIAIVLGIGIILFAGLIWIFYSRQEKLSQRLFGEVNEANERLEFRVRERTLELSSEKNRIEAIIAGTAEGIVTIGKGGEIETFNPAAEKMFGYSADEAVGQNVSILMPTAERDHHDDYLQNTGLHAPRIFDQARDLYGRKKDETIFPLEITVSPVELEGRKMFIGILRDISQRKADEEALRTAEERFNKSQVFANIGTWEWNVQTQELFWSGQIYKLLGTEAGKLKPSYENFLNTIHPDDREMVTGAIQHSIDNNVPYDIEHRVTWPDGTVRWLRETGDVERDQEGSPLRMLGIVRDVTERKYLLENLGLAKVATEKTSRAKSDFLSTMSHELRTPMNAVMGFAELLEHTAASALNDDQKTYIENILSSGKHMLMMIDRILELNRIEDGATTINVERVAARDVIDEAINLVKVRSSRAHVDVVDKTAETDLPILRTDSARLTQVLLSLLFNAVKYNDAGGTVTATAERLVSNKLRISITDTGWGIPEDKRDDLFKPFERLGLEAGAIEGAGIGLTIAKKLIELLGGQIGFESEEGKGSVFWVDAPIADEQAQDVRDATSQVVDAK